MFKAVVADPAVFEPYFFFRRAGHGFHGSCLKKYHLKAPLCHNIIRLLKKSAIACDNTTLTYKSEEAGVALVIGSFI